MEGGGEEGRKAFVHRLATFMAACQKFDSGVKAKQSVAEWNASQCGITLH